MDSLVLVSLDIGRVLADRDGVRFRTQGTCMYPTVCPGDELRIKSCTIADVNLGDIAVCSTTDFMFGHRVIDKGEHDGHKFIITRPDRAHKGSDVPTFDENLLGVVVSIKRNRKRVPLQPSAYSYLARRYYAVRLMLVEAKPRVHSWLANALTHVQNGQLYHSIAQKWISLIRPRVTYIVRVPLNPRLGDAVYRKLKPDEFDMQMEWKGNTVERWTIALHLNDAHEPATWATFVRGPDDVWGVEATHARMRYRGMGFDNALMRQAAEILARSE